MRRWLRFAPLAGAVLALGLLGAGPAAAQQGPDHLHLDLSLVGCGTLQANAFQLPKSAKLDLRFQNAANGVTLHAETVTSSADGTLTVKAKVPLTGVHDVRLSVARPGAAKPFAFSEMTIAGECPLPFTGPARAPTLARLGLVLLAAGGVLVGVTAYRGRHATRVRTS
jgi:hypothetical protein